MDWALKRVLRFAVKKNFGRYLQAELAPEQLDVALGAGRAEVRDVLLNCAAVNEQLVRGSAACRRGSPFSPRRAGGARRARAGAFVFAFSSSRTSANCLPRHPARRRGRAAAACRPPQLPRTRRMRSRRIAGRPAGDARPVRSRGPPHGALPSPLT